MNSNWRRSLDGPATEPGDAIALAGPLVASLVGFVPLVALTGRSIGVGLLPALLGALAVVGVGYLAYVYVRNQVVAGAYVSFFVLSTFAANLPLASQEFYRVTSGTVGPQLWLFQGPLLVVVGYLLWAREYTVDSFSKTELVFGSFVVWTVVTAFLGAGPRTDVALYFTWLLAQAWVVFTVVGRGVERGLVSLESVVTTYVVTVVGHAAFGAAQLWNDSPLGLTFLGEGVTWHPPLSFVVGGEYQLIPTGFTGHGYVLVSLILLTFPATLVFVHRSDSVSGVPALLGALVSVIFLRLTTSDAGRGAFLVVTVCLVAGIVALSKLSSAPRGRSLREQFRDASSSTYRSFLALVTGVLVVLSPSSRSGSSSKQVGPIDPTDPNETPTGGSTPTGGQTQTPVDVSEITSISIPLFDLTYLGPRVQQVLVGLEMFVRNPIFGVGGGNYRFVGGTYGLPVKESLSVPPSLHNIYVLLLAETGLPGFLLYFGSIALVVSSGLRSPLQGHKPYLQLSILVSFVGYLALLFFTHLVDNANSLLPFWALAGAVVGERLVDEDGGTERSPAVTSDQ
ncbi:hypothetical protein BRC81_11715 [Halobacteriales archaeon QS_1_68_20]|nr:MAG: hypothetical protein BRC81_11715 [Halobacteriales archaeon QS_1_68_20]